MIRKFVHIGYPKNFSTSLQYDFFAKHPELFHLGIGPELAYSDPLTDAAFEVYLKSTKGLKYAEVEEKLTTHFAKLIDRAEKEGKKALTISSEHLSFSFSNDALGFEEKISRLAKLIGNDLHIVAIIRNQFDLIKSLYRESVRVGYPGDYASYIYLLYKYQDRNYCYDLRYDLVYKTLCKYFKPENIHFLVFENMRQPDGTMVRVNNEITLIRSLCNELGVSYMETDFGHYNEALSDSIVIAKSELNKTNRHDLGNIVLDTAEKHRMKHYLFSELDLHEAEEVLYGDVRTKRALIAKATEEAKGKNEKLSYAVDPVIMEKLKAFYEKGNSDFAAASGVTLSDKYFNLRF
jgi:hypothetical protein